MLILRRPRLPERGLALFCLGLFLAQGCAPSGPRSLQSGVRLLHQGDYARAIEKLKVASELLPQQAQVWNHLGLAYHGAGQPENAIFAYQKALELNRDLAAARFNLGSLYLEQNNLKGAIGDVTQALLLDPNNVEALVERGLISMRQGNKGAARKDFASVLQLQPESDAAASARKAIEKIDVK